MFQPRLIKAVSPMTMQSRPLRVQRSELAVPATSPRFFAKAAAGAADTLFLDLEDAVAPAHKDQARAQSTCCSASIA